MAMEEAELLAMGARISELRDASGLGQKTIAEYCGVETRTYQFWQQGKHPPGGERLQKLSELFRSRGLDYATESYILKGPTPNLLDMPDRSEQLDRIEAKLDRLLADAGLNEPDEGLGHAGPLPDLPLGPTEPDASTSPEAEDEPPSEEEAAGPADG